ncbi:MAG TPA: arginase [Candidatus Thermoplasmatota archaeon]|nr:arginase [Candidatus Thermoplasmatota archaeon]
MRTRIIGVPLDLGADRRGVDMGPSAIRAAKLHHVLRNLGHDVLDGGNIATVESEARRIKDPRLKYLDEVLLVCKRLSQVVTKTVSNNEFPVILGGDHSIALGTMAGLAALGRNEGLIWVDAHGDFNTADTSPTGNIHGMPLAAICGLGDERLVGLGGPKPKANPKNVVLLGIRDLDTEEKKLITKSGVKYFTMRYIDEKGIQKVMQESLAVAGKGGRKIHLSFDVDVMDPAYALGTGTPSPGGLTYREAHLLMEMVSDSGQLQSLEMVEVNPLLDDKNKTGELAVGLIASALGKRII